MPKTDVRRAKSILDGRGRFWDSDATVITDEAVELFSKNPEHFFSGDDYAGNGVQSVSGYFYFKKLSALSDRMAELLSKFQGPDERSKKAHEELYGDDEPDDDEYEYTLKFGEKLTSFSDTAAYWLGQTEGLLSFEAPLNLSDQGWGSLAKQTGALFLRGCCEELSDNALEALARHEGSLALGQRELSDNAFESLARHEGDLSLFGLESLSDTNAKALAKHVGPLSIGPRDWIIIELSAAAAESLSKHQGSLRLNGLTELSDAAAESLSKHKGGLILNALTELSDTAAESLSKYEGNLTIEGLDELSDAAAESLSKHQGSLSLEQIYELSDTAADFLSKHNGQICWLDP